jgi:hypothetical protein
VTLIGYLVCFTNLPYLPWALGKHRLCDNIVNTWRVVACLGGGFALEEEHWASWTRVLSPRWHVEIWFLSWRLVLDMRMLESRSDHVGPVDGEVHMA